MDAVVKNFEQPKITPEQPIASEQPVKAVEQVVERTTESTEAIASEILNSAQATAVQSVLEPVNPEIVLARVEAVLATGLDSIFLTMDPVQQQKFKAKGEETAKKITTLLTTTKATVGKIIDLIMDWLRLIPTVNRHFLEQEAKIRADEIMAMYNSQK